VWQGRKLERIQAGLGARRLPLGLALELAIEEIDAIVHGRDYSVKERGVPARHPLP